MSLKDNEIASLNAKQLELQVEGDSMEKNFTLKSKEGMQKCKIETHK